MGPIRPTLYEKSYLEMIYSLSRIIEVEMLDMLSLMPGCSESIAWGISQDTGEEDKGGDF